MSNILDIQEGTPASIPQPGDHHEAQVLVPGDDAERPESAEHAEDLHLLQPAEEDVQQRHEPACSRDALRGGAGSTQNIQDRQARSVKRSHIRSQYLILSMPVI